jgi:acetyl-CoA carboxylase biotin carboxyl carrier protein
MLAGILPSMSELDLDAMRHALDTARRLGLRRVSIREGELAMTAVLPEPYESEVFEESGEPAAVGPVLKDVTANHVGYLRYRDPKPAIGDKVEKGQNVAEILALGLVNDVVSKVSGVLEEILVGENEPVEFGQPILRLKVSE